MNSKLRFSHLIYLLLVVTFLANSACKVVPVKPEMKPTEQSSTPEIVFDPKRQSQTGFYWPLEEPPDVSKRWFASGCEGKEEYEGGTYHIGVDLRAKTTQPVVAITDGKVILLS